MQTSDTALVPPLPSSVMPNAFYLVGFQAVDVHFSINYTISTDVVAHIVANFLCRSMMLENSHPLTLARKLLRGLYYSRDLIYSVLVKLLRLASFFHAGSATEDKFHVPNISNCSALP